MEKKHRYQQLADELEISVRMLENECKLKVGRIGTAIYRDSNINAEIVAAILKRYPNVNKMWLETGKGPIFNSTPNTLNDAGTPYTPNMLGRLRTRWNELLAKVAMDADGEELKKSLREMDNAIKELEEQAKNTTEE